MDMAATASEPKFAVDRLISESNDRWMKEEQVIDDTTVCVAFLGDFSPKQSVFCVSKLFFYYLCPI
jgi:hypothetical protein